MTALRVPDIVRKASQVFASNWVSQLAHFFQAVYLARVFGADGKGICSLITTSAALIGVVLSMGINNAVIYYAKRGRISARRGLGLVITNALCVAGLAAVLLFLFRDWLWGTFFGSVAFSSTLLIIMVAYIPVAMMNLYLVSYYLAMYELARHRVLVATAPIVTLIAMALFVTYGSANVELVLIGMLLSEMCYVVLFSADMYRNSPTAPGTAFLSLRELYAYGLRGHIGIVGNTILARVDLLIVAAYVSPTALGYYSVAKFFYQAVMSIPQATNGLLLGAFCDCPSGAALRLNQRVMGVMAVVLLGITGTAWLFGGPFIRFVYGPDFERSVPSLNLLLIAAVLSGVSASYSPLFLACGKPATASTIAVCSGTLTVSCAFILVPYFSIEGAALASIVGAISVLAMRVYFGQRTNIQPWTHVLNCLRSINNWRFWR